MKFSSRQVVIMVVAGAGVSSNGALRVENRANSGLNAWNTNASRFGFGWILLAGTVGPTRLGVTKLVLSRPYDTPGSAGEVLVEAFVRNSGSLPCNGPGTSGYTRTTLMHVWVPTRETIQLDFSGQALPVAPAGQPTCFGITYYAGNTTMTTYATAVGYKYK